MESMFLFFGMAVGMAVGMRYVPHQIKKGNRRVIEQIKRLLDKAE